MGSANGHTPKLGDYRRLEVELAEAVIRNAALAERLGAAERKVRERLTPAQARQILDRNADLERMNTILLRRNEVLARRERERKV